MSDPSNGACLDCGRRYGDEFGFPDLIIPSVVWNQITPEFDDTPGAGLLCPSCICRRLWRAGIRTNGVWTSGPLTQDDPPEGWEEWHK